MAETFNAEAARTAIRNASSEIEEMIRKFQETRTKVVENLDSNSSASAALGGQLGAAAQRAFEAGSAVNFQELRTKMDNFINYRVETIIQNSTAMEDAVQATYGN